jgi:hypothetical protein
LIADILEIALEVARALEAIGADYFIGGSVASSLQATARSTNDVDFIVRMQPRQAQELADQLGPAYAVDVEALGDAIAKRWSWNIFHLETGIKIDLMMSQSTPYDLEAFARRRRFKIDADCEPFVKTVEDSILKKLQWYRDGGEQSSTQWRDVVELIRVNHAGLERPYLDSWATQLGLAALLNKARQEALAPRAGSG